jgi:pimeloyl-ACP methyl ester carboxylesterase
MSAFALSSATQRAIVKALVLNFVLVLSIHMIAAKANPPDRQSLELFDGARGRTIAIELRFPVGREACEPTRPCPVAFISPGYGLSHVEYSFIADALAERGHLAVSIQHDLPSDPALATSGDPMTVRMPAWRRGADTLRFVKTALSQRYPTYDWSQLQLIGHSNGGDLSALALHESPDLASSLITLDSRRHPLPREPSIRLLSIRASDFEADPGVLPTAPEQAATGACIVEIAGSRHNDMHDGGPSWLRTRIVGLIERFLHARPCDA